WSFGSHLRSSATWSRNTPSGKSPWKNAGSNQPLRFEYRPLKSFEPTFAHRARCASGSSASMDSDTVGGFAICAYASSTTNRKIGLSSPPYLNRVPTRNSPIKIPSALTFTPSPLSAGQGRLALSSELLARVGRQSCLVLPL